MKTQKTLSGIFIVIILLMSSFSFLRSQDTIINKNELPKIAQNFINEHFKDQTISYIKKDNDMFSVDYEVKLNNGTEVKFDSKGNWKKVDGKHQAISNGFISKKITTYVKTQFPQTLIVEIEKEYYKQKVKISNGLELVFNSSGDFIGIDD